LPIFKAYFSSSSAYIPTELQHAGCGRQERGFPYVPVLDRSILDAFNSAWTSARDNRFVYRNEGDVIFIVRNFLESVLSALCLPLIFSTEFSLQSVRPDISVIFNGSDLVGVVAVKMPTPGLMQQPTILGELFDQLMLVEGFYGMGPVLGIITTGQEWIFSWFPADHDRLRNRSAESSSATLKRQEWSPKTYSPPGNTPSQNSGNVHSIDEEEEEESADVDPSIPSPVERLLSVTPAIDIQEHPEVLLQHLCGAFFLMSLSQPHDQGSIARCLLRLHKDSPRVSYLPVPYDQIFANVRLNRFPNRNTKNLIALEDLGRGASGKAWLCATLPTPYSSACVLKFDNNNKLYYLEKEKDLWHRIYPEFKNKVRIEHWSGEKALVMPHFTEVLEHKRSLYQGALHDTLTTKFNGLVHQDVKWNNIGVYRKDGVEVLVVFDLLSVIDYRAPDHADWIEQVMQRLF
jgi:hypothetical protein